MVKKQKEQYKNSDIQWLGKIPWHWEVNKLKHLADIVSSNVDKHIKADEIKVFLCNYTDVYYNESIDSETQLSEGSCTENEFEKNQLKANDVVITKDSEDPEDIGVPCFISENLVNTVCGYHLTMLRPSNLLGRFLFRFLQNDRARSYFALNAKGITRFALGKPTIQNITVPIPPPNEQTAIANYLDEKTGQIDRLIDIAQKKIERLQEYRTALINQVVTKGLDPNVPMKDSGIEWIGEIPEHWDVIALKYLGRLKSGSAITAEEIQDEGKHPVYGGNGVRGYNENFTHEGDYVLIGRQGALCGNINYASGKFWASEHAVVVNPRKNFNVSWMGELLRAMNLNQYSVSAAQPGLSVERVGSLRIPVPPLNEQNDIGNYLEQQKRQFDKNINLEKFKIQRLREYRQTLISEVVTGKKKVVNTEAYEPA